MNIDKFGNHVHKRLRFNDKLTFVNLLTNGNADEIEVHASRVIGIKKPESPDHAVNKDYVDHQINDLKQYFDENNSFKAVNNQISFESVKLSLKYDPLHPDDAVSKKYIDQKLVSLCSYDQLLHEVSKQRKNILIVTEKYIKDNYYSKAEIESLIRSIANHE